MKKLLLIVFLFTISGINLCAQDSLRSKKSISFGQGLHHSVSKDLYRSPYNYSGLNPSFVLAFERQGKKSLQRVQIGLVYGKVKTNFSPLASNDCWNLSYSYLRKISISKKISFHLGPQLSGISWRVNYFPEMQVPAYGSVRSYLWGFSLDLAGQMEYSFHNKNKLHLLFSFPFSAYVDRPNFLDGSPRQMEVGLFNFWQPKAQFTYEHALSEKFSLLMNYQYSYLEYSQPKPIRILNNSISLGIRKTF